MKIMSEVGAPKIRINNKGDFSEDEIIIIIMKIHECFKAKKGSFHVYIII